jgi:lipopolysaccharide/colanic/teichoic acid biosynthesis glycosyltransferase
MRLLPERISFLLLSELLLSFFCFAAAALLVFGADGLSEDRLWGLVIAAMSVVVGCFFNGLYRNLRWRSRVALILQLCGVFGIVFLLQGAFAYMRSPIQVARWVMLIGVTLNFLVMVGWRVLYASLLKKIFAMEPVLFLGVDDVVCEIAEDMAARPELGFSVAGFLSDSHEIGAGIARGGSVEGRVSDLPAAVARLRVKRIVVGVGETRQQMPVAALVAAKRRGIIVQDAGTTYELVCGRVCSRTFRPSQLVFGNELTSRPGVMALQSVYANLLGLVAFVCAVPILAVARAAIKLSSSGPSLLSEQYAGMNGIPFTASRLRCTELDNPRKATTVGAWLRALHLEYLPRIGNVVRGEMTLVGPAPVRLEFAESLSTLIPVYRQREIVKPGLTGWTQIQTDDDELSDIIRQVESDLYYTKHISLALDAYILLRSLREILGFDEQ